LAVVVILAGGLGGWASTAQISGALIAPGSSCRQSNVKKCSIRPAAVGEVRAMAMSSRSVTLSCG
jgi:HlyD family secretion protein